MSRSEILRNAANKNIESLDRLQTEVDRIPDLANSINDERIRRLFLDYHNDLVAKMWAYADSTKNLVSAFNA